MVISILAIILMVALDQIVKLWASNFLKNIGTIPIIQNIFHLTYIENRGAAFSILQGKTIFLAIVTSVILIVIVYAIATKKMHTRLGYWSLLLVAGGAIGNLIDRLARGFVVDMFDFRFIQFPVFNIADIFVTIGGVLFVFYYMVQHDKE